MSGHTPGPWEVATSCSWRRILSQDGSGVCVPTIQRSDNHPDLHFPNGGPDGPDARLIAAAPELLEALRHLTRLAGGVPTGVTQDMKREALAMAKAAIAKATTP